MQASSELESGESTSRMAFDPPHSAPVLSDARALLRRYWGYEGFRPGQEEIVRSISEGRDACVVMPTGGGKSLCYQLPAALDPARTAVVVSPLLALMQDQVAQLPQPSSTAFSTPANAAALFSGRLPGSFASSTSLQNG